MDRLTALSAFACLSQPMRLDAFRLLIKAGETGMIAGEIGAALTARQNTMSANLSVLIQSGLVRKERQGRTIRYFADMDGVGGLLAFLVEDCCGGQAELCQPLIDQIACSCSVGKTAPPRPLTPPVDH
ncbi:helix-turn-helix transcriptional regulator [Pseudoruegeria sp. SK021]|uniref:ArsR/SmtB family transcription factor n=1 Tax=Pseudoruegeria sp. SK021 TaxID=1933035 RepID=UPI000A25A960|nr:helix-turn-helix transcriptional regulator [Pseudoruegeria sp. SK021]OSP54699.1 transcriptional regulator [Pseudoruegeria sp. SK021]